MTVSVALVGFGLAGRYLHAPVVETAGMKVKAVVSSRSDQIREDLPDAEICSELTPLLSRDDIDLVILTTPNELHYPQALAALQHGKHVVTDKPFTIDSSQASHLIETAAQQKLKLSVYHNRRWDADFLTIMDLIESGELGEITSASLRWDRFRPEVRDRWRERDIAGAGLLYDLGPHLLDQAVIMAGRPDWLQADVYLQRKNALADDGFEILMGKGTMRISIGVNYLTVDGAPRYIINGSKGTFRKSWLDPQEEQLAGQMSPAHPYFGIEPSDRWGTLHRPDGTRITVPTRTGRWLSYYEGMRDAITNDLPEPVDPRAALYIMQLIETAFASSRDGQRKDLNEINQQHTEITT